jgi:penicillin-binding protein 2
MLSGAPRRLEYRTRFRVALILLIVAWMIMIGRLFQVQVLQHDRYTHLSKVSSIGKERVLARRGQILDRNGKALARNVDTHRLSVVPHYLEDPEAELAIVRDVLEMSDERFESLKKRIATALEDNQKRFRPITVSRWLTSDFCPYDGNGLDFVDEIPVRWSAVDGRAYYPLDISRARRCPVDQRRLRYSLNKRVARCPTCSRTYIMPDQKTAPSGGDRLEAATRSHSCAVCGRDFNNQYASLNGIMHQLPGFSIRTYLRRFYPFREEVSHVLGYMNQLRPKELAAEPEAYRSGDLVGRTGIEKAYEAELRGQHGEEVFVKDAKGFRRDPHRIQTTYTELKTLSPRDGKNVRLTVDSRIQALLADAMRDVDSGAAVVIDPHSGEVLGLFSKPSFDPNLALPKPTDRLSEYEKEKRKEERANKDRYSPQVNKALTAYAPGSVFKIVTSLAGLIEGLIDDHSTYKCTGYYLYKRRRFRCHNLGGHGKMDVIDSLVHSCDVFYYKLGELLGLDAISWYATQYYGYGEKTGVEIYEQAGRAPTVAWYEENDTRGFLPGFTLSVAVGQGSVLATPLQVARSFAALLNGGDLLRLRLVRSIEDDTGTLVERSDREVVRHVEMPEEYVELIRRGLFNVVNEEGGTGANVFVAELPIAGKTGTAEARERRAGVEDGDFQKWLLRSHAWFVGYAPAADPRVVVTVFLEHGGSGGKNAGPIVQRIITNIFERRPGTLQEAR